MFTGTTVCILCIKEKKLFFAKADDWRNVLCKNGDAFSIIIEHKPEIPSELKRIEKVDRWDW